MKLNKDKLELEDLTKEPESLVEELGSSDLISLLAIQELLNMKNLKTITRLKPDQIMVLTKLHLFSKTFDIPFCDDIAELIEKLQISINGLGRKEFVQLVQQRADILEKAPKLSSKDIFR